MTRSEFITACERLNVNMLEPLIEDHEEFCGMPKWEFLAYLRDLFAELDDQEVGSLKAVEQFCRVCHPKMEILEFYEFTHASEYWRYHRRLDDKRVVIPKFAFAITRNTKNHFDIERCFNSSGFKGPGSFKGKMELLKLIQKKV
ncbi:hypothetical protein [Robertkochia sediminum]|uniref:hypothetical protein n=1 Tax=Robertkochia sediminum TaxID=2785326 RepID=UPI0019326240|nr:hypothetical protein [Robertkochia sediminum]MBL7471448.1 hypothetical protein [Robertkochia sediminum]